VVHLNRIFDCFVFRIQLNYMLKVHNALICWSNP